MFGYVWMKKMRNPKAFGVFCVRVWLCFESFGRGGCLFWFQFFFGVGYVHDVLYLLSFKLFTVRISLFNEAIRKRK